MGPEPAINAVYFNKINELDPEARKSFVAEKIKEYEADVDILKLAGELIVDQMIDYHEVRAELIQRFGYYSNKVSASVRRAGILPM